MNASGDMDIDPGILSPEAAKKQVSHITPSGWNFLLSAATAEYFNKLTLLKFLCLNTRIRRVV